MCFLCSLIMENIPSSDQFAFQIQLALAQMNLAVTISRNKNEICVLRHFSVQPSNWDINTWCWRCFVHWLNFYLMSQQPCSAISIHHLMHTTHTNGTRWLKSPVVIWLASSSLLESGFYQVATWALLRNK